MRKLLNIGLSLGASLVVGLIALWTLETLQLKYVLAFTLSLLVFALMNLYTPYNKSFSLPLTQANIRVKIWWLSWLSAILLVVSTNPLETSSQFLVWNEIPVLIWLRLIASFSLATIYPGHGLTVLIFRGRDLQLLEKTVFSVLLSIFMSSTIAFVGTLIDGSIGILSLLILLSVNTLLFVATSYSARRNLFSKAKAQRVLSIKLTDIVRALLLSALIVFVSLSVYSVSFPDRFVPTIDQWLHYGNILRTLNGTLFSLVPSFYWLYMFEGLFIFGSGAPLINAYMTSFVICVVPILCFYLMCSGFWNKRKALVATTAYTLFSGFGGFYANYLRLTDGKDIAWITSYAANRTYDISTGAVSFSFYLFPKLIGLSTVFTLVYLIYDNRLPRLGRGILISAFLALGYFTHAAEVYVFLMVATLLALFSRKDISNLKDLPYALISSLITIAIVDLLAPQKKYGLYYLLTGPFHLAAFGLVSIVISLSVVSLLKLDLSSIGKFTTRAVKKLSFPIVVVFVYILTLSVMVWTFLLPAFSIGYTGGTFVWYLYPVRLGIMLFMAVPAAYQLFRSGEFRILKLSLIIILTSVSLERALSYVIAKNMMQFALFSPIRMVEFAWIGVAMLATAVLISILKCATSSDHAKREISSIPRRFASTVLLVIIVIAGSSSALYNVQIRSMPPMALTNNELEALDFLRNETPPNATVLALGYSANKVNDFGGRFPMMYYQPAVFGANNFEAFVDIMKHNTYELYGHCPVKYFWLSNSDAGEIKEYEKGYFVSHLLNFLPVLYENSEVTIFEIPSLSPPSSESELVVVKSTANMPSESMGRAMSIIALAGLNYTVRYDFDLKTTCSTLFLADDPNDDLLNYSLTSTAKKLIVFNTDASNGQFAKLLKIDTNPNEKRIIDGISSSYMTLSLPPLEIPTFSSLQNDVETLAYYTKDGQSLSPYAFGKAVGNHEIIYVETYPYFEMLQRNAGTDIGVEIFTKLGDLINVLDPQLPKYKSPSNPIGRAISYGETTFEGDISVNTTSFYIPAMDSKWTQGVGWREDTFCSRWSTSTNKPENGSIDISPDGDILSVTFDASAKNTWQYLFLNAPEVNASQFHFLLLKEKIEASSYNLGYLRIVVGGYTYNIKGWSSETHPPGHPWKTYVFDLRNAIPEKSKASTRPEGPITQIYWTGYSTGENGGTARLYLDYIVLTSSLMNPTNYGEIIASLDFSEASAIFIDGLPTAERTLVNTKILDMKVSGDYNSTFASTEAELIPPGLTRYSKIAFSKGCDLTLWLTNDSQISFTTLFNGKPSNITVSGGKIHVKLTPLKDELVAYLSEAQISVNGYTQFEKAFISWPYAIYNPELPMEVSGLITFKVNMMDQDFSLFSQLKVDGNYKVLTEQQVKWNEWDIPWLTILTSPYHIILVSSIVAGLAVHTWWRKHEIKTSLKLR